MNISRRGLALALAALLGVLPLAGCAEQEAGVSLSVCVGGQPESLDPLTVATAADQTVLSHIYENLMRTTVDVSGAVTVTNGMAKSVSSETNYDGTVTYTFKLRSARWSDGRPVKASDFVYAWQRLADPVTQSPNAALLSVVQGYAEARASGDLSLLQVTAKNDSTLIVTLDGCYEWFLNEVCTSPATMPLRQTVLQSMKEDSIAANEAAQARGLPGDALWWSDAARLTSNGPYQVESLDGDQLVLTRNERYYLTENGPEQITFRFADTPEEAQALYDAKETDLIWPLSAETLAASAENEEWQSIPVLTTYTVLLNTTSAPLDDPLARQALFQTVDRNALCELVDVTARPAGGLVPPGVPGGGEEDFRTEGGALIDSTPENYTAARSAARQLLEEEGGYDLNENFADVELIYVDSGPAKAVVELLAQMWQSALHLNVTLRAVTEKEMRTSLNSGEYQLAYQPLSAKVNDAESFLRPWSSKNEGDSVFYANSAYDTLLSIVSTASDNTARLGCLHDAESLLLADQVLIPLYTAGTDWTLRETLTGICRDSRGFFQFSAAHLREV